MTSYRDPIVDAAAELMRTHPGLDVRRAYQLVIDADPDLYQHRAPDGSTGHPGDRVAPETPARAHRPLVRLPGAR